jgi:hypothetical protein
MHKENQMKMCLSALGLLEGAPLWWVTALYALWSDGIVEAVKGEKE